MKKEERSMTKEKKEQPFNSPIIVRDRREIEEEIACYMIIEALFPGRKEK